MGRFLQGVLTGLAAAAVGLGLLLALPPRAAPAISAFAASAAPASPAKGKERPAPSYTIPNIAAIIMCLTALAVACKRYRQA